MTSLRRWVLGAAATLLLVSNAVNAAHADPEPNELVPGSFSIGPAAAREVGDHGTVLFPVFESARADLAEDAEPDFYAYCIEMDVRARFDVDVEPAPWSDFPGHNNFTNDAEVQRKVGWIVDNSYPTISLDELRRRAAIANLTTAEAISGTQYAIWHFTDGSKVKLSANADKLRTYLTGGANVGLPESRVRPAVTLVVDAEANTDLGAPIGPISVEANTGPILVTTDDGHRFIDSDAEEIDANRLTSGQQFYLDIPADAGAGATRIHAQVDAARLNGSILKVPSATSAYTHAQTLILVKGETATSSDSVKVSWAPPKLPDLATPVVPDVHVEECKEPGESPEARLEPHQTEGIEYEFDDAAVYPGAVVRVTARALEGYELGTSEGWEIEEDGTAHTQVEIPEPDCPAEEDPPPPEPPVAEQPPADEEPAEPPAPVLEEEPPARTPPEPELAETGAPSLGLFALSGALLSGGTTIFLTLRHRRHTDPS